MKSYVSVGFIGVPCRSGHRRTRCGRQRGADGAVVGRSDAVQTLEASGYNVIVNRTGAAPLSQCTVSAVRPGQTHSTKDSRGGSSINTTITSKTVYVDVAC